MENKQLSQEKAQNFSKNSFWKVSDTGKVSIMLVPFLDFLKSLGIFRFDVENGFAFIKIENNIAENIEIFQVQDYFFRAFKTMRFEDQKISKGDVLEALLQNLEKIFKNTLLSRLNQEVACKFIEDSKEKAYLFFKNACVEISENEVECKAYDKVEGYIWKNQLLSRDFEHKKYDFLNIDYTKESKNYPFPAFIWFVSKEDKERFIQLASIIGYTLHSYQHAKRKAICFTDSSLESTNNGRTGKTLLAKAIGKIKAYTEISGKDFRADNKHKYQTCNLDTQIIHINDLVKNFIFEILYNDITEGVSVEKKNQTPFTIRPKIILSTNHAINTQGNSSIDRIVEYEFSDFFSPKRTPQNFFGKLFFEEWNEKEWNVFDNFMIWCIQIYLKNGILEPTNENLAIKKLKASTSPEFLEWANDKRTAFELAKDKEIYFDRSELRKEFIAFAEIENEKQISSHKFKNWLNLYFEHIKIKIKDARTATQKGRFGIEPY